MLGEEGLFVRLAKRVVGLIQLPYALVVLWILNFLSFLKSLWQRTNVAKISEPSPGSPILLFAAWEQRELRPDEQRLLRMAKEIGYFTLVVNTGVLKPVNYPVDADSYLEIPNFGRDFASYKKGFSLIHQSQWASHASRIVMSNDSVFYSSHGLRNMLIAASEENAPLASGATENFEIERHLGSFFISLDPEVFSHPKFLRFWRRYRRSDIRSKVIRRGELRLSKVIRRVVPETEFKAMFDIALITKQVGDLKMADLDSFFALGMTSPGALHWNKARLPTVAEEWRNRHRALLLKSEGKLEIKASEGSLHLTASSLQNLLAEISTKFPSLEAARTRESLASIALQEILDAAASGSQIHNSALTLFKLGLPIIKLDLIYRGAGTFGDVTKLAFMLDREERSELLALLYTKPFGGHTLTGWKYAAFMRGHI